MINYELNEFYEAEEKEKKDDKDELVTMYDCFKPLIERDDDEDSYFSLSRTERVKLSKVRDYDNLYYIPGHLSLSDIDYPMCLGIEGISKHKNDPAAVTNFFREVARRKEIDIVLFDLGSGTAGLNPTIIMGSDYWIIPFFPDSLSKQAIKNLQTKLPKWNKLPVFETLRKKTSQWHMEARPLFLGAFPQKVKYIKDKTQSNAYKVTHSQGVWISKINKEIQEFHRILIKEKALSENFEIFLDDGGYGIRDFIRLGYDVQHEGRPICDREFPFSHYVRQELESGEIVEVKGRPWEKPCLEQDQIFLGYDRLISILLQNMKNEDIDMLGADFREKIYRYSKLKEDNIEIKTVNNNIIKYGESVEIYKYRKGEETRRFTQYSTSGEGGDCGFRILGLSREVAGQKLLEEQKNVESRKLISEELLTSFERFKEHQGGDPTTLMDEKIRTKIGAFYDEYVLIKQRSDGLYGTVRQRLVELKIELPRDNWDEYILFNIRANRFLGLEEELKRSFLDVDNQFVALKERWRDDKEILREYITKCIATPDGLYLGTKSLYCIAKSMGKGLMLFGPRQPSFNLINRLEPLEAEKKEIMRGNLVLIMKEEKSPYQIGFAGEEQYAQIILDEKQPKHKELISLLNQHRQPILNNQGDKHLRDCIYELIRQAGGRRELIPILQPLSPVSAIRGSMNAVLIGAHYSFLADGEVDQSELPSVFKSTISSTQAHSGKKRKEKDKNETELRRSKRESSELASARISGIFSGSSSNSSGQKQAGELPTFQGR